MTNKSVNTAFGGSRRILVLGSSGQVGWELCRTLMPLGQVVPAGMDEPSLPVNLADPDSLRAVVRQVQPQVIVNAAAYTAVDQAESEPELAMAVNGTAPGVLAEEAAGLDALLVHYSTDYVFDGRKGSPYVESDPVSPMSVYGKTKLAGEEAVAAVGGHHVILRTSWVYGARGRNFLLTMLRLAQEREVLRVVADQQGSPTWCRFLAEATAQIVAWAGRSPEARVEAAGLYHLSAMGCTTWHGFTCAIVEQARGFLDCKIREVQAITTEEYPTPAARPPYSLLSNDKLMNRFGIHVPSWQDQLTRCLQEVAGQMLKARA